MSHTYKKVLERANKPTIKKLAMWEGFVVDVLAPTFHDIRQVRAAMKIEPPSDNDTPEILRSKELARRVRTSIVGWSGLKDDDGKDVSFSEEEAVRLFGDPEMEGYANRFITFLGELQEEALRNPNWTKSVTGAEVEAAIKK